MITAEEFHKAIIDHLRHAGFSEEEYDVYFERNEIPAAEGTWDAETGEYFAESDNEESDSNPKPYFYVDIQEKSQAVDDVYFDRHIAISIELHLLPTATLEIDKSVLWQASDALALEFHMVFTVADRKLSVIDTSRRIFSDVLHYRFELDFADYKPIIDDHDVMENLDAKINVWRQTIVVDEPSKEE